MKNIEEGIKIVSFLKEEIPDITYRVVGPVNNESYFNRLRTLVKKLNLEENIEFLGRKTGKELNTLVASSWAFLLPSIYEPAGLVVSESLALGTPVVARRSPGPETIRDISEAGECIRLYENTQIAVDEVLDVFSRYRKLVKRCKDAAVKLTWKEIVDRIEAIYTDVLR